MKRLALIFLFCLALCRADYLGSWAIDDYLTVMSTTHSPTTGAASASSAITMRIYEDDTDTEIVSDQNMTAFDSVTGLYKYKQQLTAAAGFEVGKCYTVLISATVDTVTAITTHTFQIQAKTTAVTVSDKTSYGLADDAITAAKFDESTAFPLKSADTGATTVARTGADSDTLETLSDQIDGVPAAVWDVELRGLTTFDAGHINDIVSAVWLYGDRALSDEPPTAAAIKTALEAAGGSIASILADTGELQTDLANGGRLDLLVDAIKAKTDLIPASPAEVGSAMTLTSAYDAAKDDVLTPLSVVDGLVDAIKAKTDQLTFTTPNSVDATASATITEENIEDIADAVIAGVVAAPEISRIGEGTGAIAHTYTVTNSQTGSPIPDVQIAVFSDAALTVRVARATTNNSGEATLYLNAGTYYFVRTKAGYSFTNPDIEEVTE